MEREYVDELVSVIIPMYNSELYIKEAINSVVTQSYENFEIIVVDDCSIDNSAKIVSQYMEKESKIRYIKMKKNSGVALARNKGIEAAKGRYIAFLDSDDVWKSNKLEIQLSILNGHLNTPFTYTAIDIIDEAGNFLKNKRKVIEEVSYKYLLRNTMIATSSVLLDRKVVCSVKFPVRKSAEDYSLWLSLLKKYGNAYGINENLVSYRKTSNQLTSSKVKEVKYFFYVQTEDMGIGKISALLNTVVYIWNAVKKHYF